MNRRITSLTLAAIALAALAGGESDGVRGHVGLGPRDIVDQVEPVGGCPCAPRVKLPHLGEDALAERIGPSVPVSAGHPLGEIDEGGQHLPDVHK